MPDEQREWDAAGLVAGHVPGLVVKTDVGGAQGTHDFEIRAEGRTTALEVTSSTVPEVKGMWDAVQGQNWESEVTRYGWSISLRAGRRGVSGAPIRKVRERVERLLAALEDERVRRFGAGVDGAVSSATSATIEALSDLGVKAGGSIGPPQVGRLPLILIGTTGPGGSPDGEHVNRAVEREALANAEKLARSDCDERHLFMWTDWTDTDCDAAMALGALPVTSPALPEGVDVVWVASRQPGPTVPTTVQWRMSRTEPWRSVTVRFVRNSGRQQ